MTLRERVLYHQIHPIKLATDIGSALVAIVLLWRHAIGPSIIVALVPPILVSVALLTWPPNLERIAQSPFGRYVRTYMTSWVEAVRFLTLVPMAYGAWRHDARFILLGVLLLVAAWCNGLIIPRVRTSRT